MLPRNLIQEFNALTPDSSQMTRLHLLQDLPHHLVTKIILIYPKIRWNRISDVLDLICEMHHFDREDFESFNHSMRKSLAKRHLYMYDCDVHLARVRIRRAHHSHFHEKDLINAIVHGAEIRQNMYGLCMYLQPRYQK